MEAFSSYYLHRELCSIVKTFRFYFLPRLPLHSERQLLKIQNKPRVRNTCLYSLLVPTTLNGFPLCFPQDSRKLFKVCIPMANLLFLLIIMRKRKTRNANIANTFYIFFFLKKIYWLLIKRKQVVSKKSKAKISNATNQTKTSSTRKVKSQSIRHMCWLR